MLGRGMSMRLRVGLAKNVRLCEALPKKRVGKPCGQSASVVHLNADLKISLARVSYTGD